jgi:predicted dehydrogenase/threonine dehydrogenase-like Zn-dependent dehydrogenase
MKQILQSLKTGKIELIDGPVPRVEPGSLLIRTRSSVISTGTERMLLEFGKANLIKKARQQPGKVRMVLDKIKTDGLLPTLEAVRSKLDEPLAMGYSSCGVVLETGGNTAGFSVGDRVVSNGYHAEVVCVPANLCARIPDGVDDETAAFTVIGSIALEGIRLAQPTLGETFVVTGLGLIGLLAVQILRANGCRVIGIDMKERNLELAREFGAGTVDLSQGEDPVEAAVTASRGRGVDGVIITAVTPSSEPVHQAALMSRKRGRIVLVGVTGLELAREDFYEKELSFQVSCSYGPGRYDKAYEEKGMDYPFGLVRWTEQRNFEAVLDMMAEGRLTVEPLISHRFALEDAEDAYGVLEKDRAALGILLEYPETDADREVLRRKTVWLTSPESPPSGGESSDPAVGFIGAGNYATRILIPAFQRTGVRLESIASSGGTSGAVAGRKFGFRRTTTLVDELIADDSINTVVIASPHNQHARYAGDALRAGKHVFVEKPLAITREDLAGIEDAYVSTRSYAPPPVLAVGFNRRFAPHTKRIKNLLTKIGEPKSFVMTVNAGAVPADHWKQDPLVGGGRIIGEGCHFIDLLRFLAGHPIAGVHTVRLGTTRAPVPPDSVSFTLAFGDGSMGTVHYLANGHKAFPKERLEVFCGGRILQLDNFRKLNGHGWPGFKKMSLMKQDKGQTQCVAAFVAAVREGGPSPTPFEEMVEVTETSFQVAEAAAR